MANDFIIKTRQQLYPQYYNAVTKSQKTSILNSRIKPADYDVLTIAQNDKKITFGEGIKLVATGFWNKTKNVAKAIIKHPVAVIGSAILMSAGLLALPLIGISTSVGASALAIGFGLVAIGKTIYHSSKALKHSENNQNNEARRDLQKVGGDALDLALSLPFVPKAVKTIKDHIKYAPKMGFNTKLWESLKETKGILNKLFEFPKADLRIKYAKMTNEMGLKDIPALEFEKFEGSYKKFTGVCLGDEKMIVMNSPRCFNTIRNFIMTSALKLRNLKIFDPLATKVINSKVFKQALTMLKKDPDAIINRCNGIMKYKDKFPNGFEAESVLRHELEHHLQKTSKAEKYAEAAKNYVNANDDVFGYLSNLKEVDARKAQAIYYKKNAQGRPSLLTSILEAVSAFSSNQQN